MDKYRKEYNSMKDISESFELSGSGKKLFHSDAFLHFRLQKKWKDIIGEDLAKYSYIGYGKNNTLYIYVTNSALTQHLFMMKAELIRKIREDEYGKRFTDIRFLAGPPKKDAEGHTSIDKINEKISYYQKLYDRDITDKEKEDIRKWTALHIKDEKLQKTFQKLIARAYQKDKAETTAGWHPCPGCGMLIPKEEMICLRCENKWERTMEGNVLLVLKENPHYRYENCKEEIEKKGKNIRISYETYEKAREKLIQNLREKIFQKTDSALNKRILLALLIHKPLKNITLREAETTLRQMAETKFSDMEK